MLVKLLEMTTDIIWQTLNAFTTCRVQGKEVNKLYPPHIFIGIGKEADHTWILLESTQGLLLDLWSGFAPVDAQGTMHFQALVPDLLQS